MLPYKDGVITAFKHSGVYVSPDGRNLGGGGNTVKIYRGEAEVVRMQLWGDGVATLFDNGVWYCSPNGRNVGGGGNTNHCS